jgi:hypothetical protein
MDNKSQEITQEVFSVLVETMGDYFVKLAILQFPFLGLPVVKQAFGFIVKKVFSKIQSEGELIIAFKFIDQEREQSRIQYDTAIEELKEVLASQTTTQEQKDEALKVAKEKLRNLIRFPVK